MTLPIIWLIALIFFTVIEAISVGLVSIWFAAGAFVALLASLFIANPWTLLVIFLVVSFATLLSIRPLVQKYMTPKQVPTNVDRLIGMHAVVEEEINTLKAAGVVKVSGVVWSAKTQENMIIPVGSVVTIQAIQGSKLVVTLEEIQP